MPCAGDKPPPRRRRGRYLPHKRKAHAARGEQERATSRKTEDGESTSGATVELCHDEFAMPKRFGGRQAAVRRAHDHVDQGIAGRVEG
jgi:hypothetical protein